MAALFILQMWLGCWKKNLFVLIVVICHLVFQVWSLSYPLSSGKALQSKEQGHDLVSHENLAVLIIHVLLLDTTSSRNTRTQPLAGQGERTSLQKIIHLFSAGKITELSTPDSHAFEAFSINSRFQRLLCESLSGITVLLFPNAFNFFPHKHEKKRRTQSI